MTLWIWRNVRLELPADWEMLQFSRNVQEGRCAFADRYQFRLELSWRATAGRPDFARMISDYVARLKEQGAANARRLRHGPWHGLQGDLDGQRTSRFGRYLPAESCLVELVFLWPERRDVGLEQKVLSSVAVEPEHLGRFRRWSAFGMDFLTSKDLQLQACTVEPASVEMTFGDAKRGAVERFARRGMVPEWMNQTTAEWLRGWVDGGVRVTGVDAADARGHRVDRLDGEKRVPGVLRRSLRCDAAAWICPRDGRLYSTSLASPAKEADTGPAPAGARLSCCSGLELPI